MNRSSRMRGANAYRDGVAAEQAVAQHYERQGHHIAARRWRSAAGEIDLIARKDGNVIFIEVKKSRSHAQAAQALSPRQMQRIYGAAEIFLGGEPAGLDSAARIDVALVDRQGKISILENAICA